MRVSPSFTCIRTVFGFAHLNESAHRLALRAGGKEGNLVVWKPTNLVEWQKRPVRDLHVAEPHADVEVALHASPDNRNLPPSFFGDLEDLLHFGGCCWQMW